MSNDSDIVKLFKDAFSDVFFAPSPWG